MENVVDYVEYFLKNDEDNASNINENNNEEKHQEIKFITRDMLGAGKHYLNTKGWVKIILSQDLSKL